MTLLVILGCYAAFALVFALYRWLVVGEQDPGIIVSTGLFWPVVAVAWLAWFASLVIHLAIDLVFRHRFPPSRY